MCWPSPPLHTIDSFLGKELEHISTQDHKAESSQWLLWRWRHQHLRQEKSKCGRHSAPWFVKEDRKGCTQGWTLYSEAWMFPVKVPTHHLDPWESHYSEKARWCFRNKQLWNFGGMAVMFLFHRCKLQCGAEWHHCGFSTMNPWILAHLCASIP